MWPVDPGQRGTPLNPGDPATLAKGGDSYPTVWGSYPDGYRPVPGRLGTTDCLAGNPDERRVSRTGGGHKSPDDDQQVSLPVD